MKTTNPTISLISGTPTEAAKKLCKEFNQHGISVIVKSKVEPTSNRRHEQVQQLTGQAGQDLFFNGWKLLF